MNANILIIEDQEASSLELKNYLLNLGYTIVGICPSPKDAYQEIMASKIDLILMNDKLLGNNGIDVVKQIREDHAIPIIFLSERMDKKIIDKAMTLDPIAYLLNPFNHRELCVAIKIGLSHVYYEVHTLRGDILLDHEFSFDTKSAQLICCSEEVHLSKKERMLLELFLKYQNTLISFMTMEYELWADKPSNDSRRRTLISRLRAKLKHRFIETYASEGYIFKIPIRESIKF
ncbi:MAG: Two-component hybrid sensor and regulator [uncultured Sulfurovum sp.]|uniref:Two-component hybrid sensor and regulator n=1 Tax=uncultured Sulfurovum sp. TaxID=269237 RepID=A0A6S6SPN5_9BACT|nr:MAG: Two-component hybrid sensor and regulator [uncultured Sulfurovum sp.]